MRGTIVNLEFFFRALTTIWGVGEIPLAVFTQTRQGEGKIQDRGTQIILWVVIIGSFKIEEWIHGFLPVDMPGSYSWLRPTALGMLILGLGVRIVGNRYAGRGLQHQHSDARRTKPAAKRTL
jgi:hypothetical protein